MNVKELKELLNGLPDDAIVLARNRDCISLQVVDVIGHKDHPHNEKSKDFPFVRYHSSIREVYGGESFDDWLKEDGENITGAIIFCDGT